MADHGSPLDHHGSFRENQASPRVHPETNWEHQTRSRVDQAPSRRRGQRLRFDQSWVRTQQGSSRVLPLIRLPLSGSPRAFQLLDKSKAWEGEEYPEAGRSCVTDKLLHTLLTTYIELLHLLASITCQLYDWCFLAFYCALLVFEA